MLEINVIAVADLTRLVLPLLRASHGDVIMINSGSGFLRTPPAVAYTQHQNMHCEHSPTPYAKKNAA